jgi:hypothetical protein
MGGAFVFQRGVIPGLPCLYKMVVKRVISVWARLGPLPYQNIIIPADKGWLCQTAAAWACCCVLGCGCNTCNWVAVALSWSRVRLIVLQQWRIAPYGSSKKKLIYHFRTWYLVLKSNNDLMECNWGQ